MCVLRLLSICYVMLTTLSPMVRRAVTRRPEPSCLRLSSVLCLFPVYVVFPLWWCGPCGGAGPVVVRVLWWCGSCGVCRNMRAALLLLLAVYRLDIIGARK